MKMQGEPINLPSILSQVADIGLSSRSSRNLQIHPPASLLESNKYYFLSLYDDEFNGSEDENESTTELTCHDTNSFLFLQVTMMTNWPFWVICFPAFWYLLPRRRLNLKNRCICTISLWLFWFDLIWFSLLIIDILKQKTIISHWLRKVHFHVFFMFYIHKSESYRRHTGFLRCFVRSTTKYSQQLLAVLTIWYQGAGTAWGTWYQVLDYLVQTGNTVTCGAQVAVGLLN